MTDYSFRNPTVQRLAEHLCFIVPIRYRLNPNLRCRAEMDCNAGVVSISFRADADEHVDILHELLHVQQFFEHRFCQLAWITNDPRITGELRHTVNLIRICVDDSWVFWRLHNDYGVFPISDVFFSECENDCNRGVIGHVQDERAIQNKSLQAAWRTRMAELCVREFGSGMSPDRRSLCERFLAKFRQTDQLADQILGALPLRIETPENHQDTLVVLRNLLGFSENHFHLARYTTEFVLRRIPEPDDK